MPRWKRSIDKARRALYAAERSANMARCSCIMSQTLGPWWVEDVRCLLDKGHAGSCVFHERGLKEQAAEEVPEAVPLQGDTPNLARNAEGAGESPALRKIMAERGYLSCSFCGKSAKEVHIIAGPSVYICYECVDLCSEIKADELEGTVHEPKDG